MVIKTGLGSISSEMSNVSSNQSGGDFTIQAGRVFAIINTRNTPTSFQFDKYGGFEALGTIFYKDFDESKNEVGSSTDDGFLNGCSVAKPFFPQFNYFPLLGEVVYIIDLLHYC